MGNYSIVQLSESCFSRAALKLKRKHIEYCRINIIDCPAFNDLLIAMLYYPKPSSKTHRFLNFGEILDHSWCQCRIGECKRLRLSTCFSYNHWHAVNTIFIYIEI